jgi:hypothetical protein
MTSVIRLLIALAVVGAVALIGGCGQTATVRQVAPTQPSRPLPATVNGVPLAALARQALNESKMWSVADPKAVLVVVSSQAGIEHLLGYNYGSTTPAYVVSLKGRFRCELPSCAPSGLPVARKPATTDPPRPVPVSYMTLQVPIPLTSKGGGELSVGRIDPNLSQLGHVHSLGPYVASLR